MESHDPARIRADCGSDDGGTLIFDRFEDTIDNFLFETIFAITEKKKILKLKSLILSYKSKSDQIQIFKFVTFFIQNC